VHSPDLIILASSPSWLEPTAGCCSRATSSTKSRTCARR
jgi:hypothetical protein